MLVFLYNLCLSIYQSLKDVFCFCFIYVLYQWHRNIVNCNFSIDLCTIVDRPNKVTVHETQKRLAAQQDPTEENVQQLLSLDNNRINNETVTKV